MTLRLYDTWTRQVTELSPRVPGQIGIYLCGLTVQSGPHIGHLRSGVNYDVLRRWLLRSGYQVTLIRNITDIDDKVLAKAAEAGRPFWSIAYGNERLLAETYQALNVLPPTYEPRATGHIPEIQELIQELLARGHAYQATDGSGDVYFDVTTYPEYGALSRQQPADMQPAEDGDPRGKRDPRDFALWKGAKPDEPAEAQWPSPWGRGRPGWHIECSAMARRYLGDEFDIHGGGLDLIFPHHENEIAQSRAAGYGFARYWVHHGLLNFGEAKMSKSFGNAGPGWWWRPVSDSGAAVIPWPGRTTAPGSTTRRVAARESAVTYQRIEGFVRRAPSGSARASLAGVRDFTAAMDDDLNTPQAMAAVQEVVREGNTAYAEGDGRPAAGALASVRGCWTCSDRPAGSGLVDRGQRAAAAGGGRVAALALEQRQAARERKDYATADTIRDQLKQIGVVVEDTSWP